MRPGDLRWALAVPVVAYALAVLVLRSPPWDLAAALVTLALAVPFLDIAPHRLGGLGYVPSVAVALVGIGAAATRASDLLPSLAVGLLVGGPLFALAVSARLRHGVGSSLVATGALLVLADLELATVRAVPVSAGTLPATTWSGALGGVFMGQRDALAAIVTGASIPPAPLGFSGDGVFDALALLAAFGYLATLVLADRSGAADAAAERAEALRAVEDPRLATAGVVVAAMAAFGGVVAGGADPGMTLVAIPVLLAEVVVAVVVVTRYFSARSRRR